MKKLDKEKLIELKDLFQYGDDLMLEELEEYIPKKEKNLYRKVMDYNEVYANGWTINDLYEMGKDEDPYWTMRANYFVKEYKISKENYKTDYIDDYFEFRNKLLKKLNIYNYICDIDINEMMTPGIEKQNKLFSLKFYDIDEIDLIYHGEWSDPEIKYKNNLYSYYDLKDQMIEIFQEMKNKRRRNKNILFKDWVTQNKEIAFNILDNLIPNSQIDNEEGMSIE